MIRESLEKLNNYIENEAYKGYDPYDTLNSFIPFHWFGRWGGIIAIQLQKRNPINIRPLLGIKKFQSTKGMALILSAYLNIYSVNNDETLIPKIENIIKWLLNNRTSYLGSICWGYDYPYYTMDGKVNKGFPTVIHHSYIIKALFEYYMIFNDNKIKKIIIESEEFVTKHLKLMEFEKGLCFSYSPKYEGCCYNASLHAASCLARVYYFTKDVMLLDIINKAMDFVTNMQKDDGKWYYGFKNYGGPERKQIDFHQGFILESYSEICTLINSTKESWEEAIKRGLNFYYNSQFDSTGRSFWRIPKEYPVDIHNQSQGIITFLKMAKYNSDYKFFAKKIAIWSIKNMQNKKKGFFYYRKYKYYTNKIPYMRWSEAWMFLALSELYVSNNL